MSKYNRITLFKFYNIFKFLSNGISNHKRFCYLNHINIVVKEVILFFGLINVLKNCWGNLIDELLEVYISLTNLNNQMKYIVLKDPYTLDQTLQIWFVYDITYLMFISKEFPFTYSSLK